jgi:hypothetical protein
MTLGDGLAYRTLPSSHRRHATPTVLLSGGGDDALRVLVHDRPVVLLRGVRLLGLHIPAAKLDSGKLVAANPAEQDLLQAGRGVKSPLSGRIDDGNRERILLRTDHQSGRCSSRVAVDAGHLPGLCGEAGHLVLVLHSVLGDDKVHAGFAEDLPQGRNVVLLSGANERLGRGLGGWRRSSGSSRYSPRRPA